jgi:hypothetical protein
MPSMTYFFASKSSISLKQLLNHLTQFTLYDPRLILAIAQAIKHVY